MHFLFEPGEELVQEISEELGCHEDSVKSYLTGEDSQEELAFELLNQYGLAVETNVREEIGRIHNELYEELENVSTLETAQITADVLKGYETEGKPAGIAAGATLAADRLKGWTIDGSFYSQNDIAEAAGVSQPTVSTHYDSIMEYLVENRLEEFK